MIRKVKELLEENGFKSKFEGDIIALEKMTSDYMECVDIEIRNKISESSRGDIEDIKSLMEMLSEIHRIRGEYNKVNKDNTISIVSDSGMGTVEIYTETNRDGKIINAKGVYTYDKTKIGSKGHGEIMLLKGSEISKKVSGITPGAEKFRGSLLITGAMEEFEDCYILNRDVKVGSIGMTSNVVMGRGGSNSDWMVKGTKEWLSDYNKRQKVS